MAKTEIENSYDILQNKDGDIMFSVLEREGEPDKPELVYDGGEHALLNRNGGHTVIFDFINPDIRQSLVQAKEVLIAEHSKADKNNFVREYIAAVKIVKRLPEEYNSLLSEHKNEMEKGKFKFPLFDGKDDDPERSGARVRRMLMEDPREAERVAKFYTDMANDGNPAAQFELANFYLEGIGVKQDDEEAKEWLQKAAAQGHETAIELLEVIEKKPKVIFDQSYRAKTEMPCAQCGTIVPLKKSYLNKHILSSCPKCGAYYEYIHCEPPMDGGPDEWA